MTKRSPNSSAYPPHPIVVVVERGAALPGSWLRPRGDVIILNEIESELAETFAQRVVRAVTEIAKASDVAEVRLFASQANDDVRLRARSRIALALLAAMRSSPSARITLVANRVGRAQHDLFALADAIRTEASTNVSVCLNFRSPTEEPEALAAPEEALAVAT
jgi:hypothetical protein